MFFFFQAEDGIRDAQESRGLGDVYKRQLLAVRPRTMPMNSSISSCGLSTSQARPTVVWGASVIGRKTKSRRLWDRAIDCGTCSTASPIDTRSMVWGVTTVSTVSVSYTHLTLPTKRIV